MGVICGDSKQPVFTAVYEAATGERDLSNCGLEYKADVSNRELLPELRIGDVVRVGGGFPLTVTRVSGGNGVFTGEGVMPLRWVLNAEFAVEFVNLLVNTNYEQIGGRASIMYNTKKAMVGDLDAFTEGGVVENTRNGIVMPELTLDFVIPENPVFEYNPQTNELMVFSTDGGEPQAVQMPKNDGKTVFPVTVKDKEGNLYKVENLPPPSSEGGGAESPSIADSNQPLTATYLGKQGEVLPELDNNNVAYNTAIVSFEKGGGNYAFDTWQDYYQSVSIIDSKKVYEHKKPYHVPWKLLPAGESDVVKAKIELIDKSFNPEKVIFSTPQGVTFKSAYDSKNKTYTLSLAAGQDNDVQEIYALNKLSNENYQTLGKLNVITYKKQSPKLVIVNINNYRIDEQSLKAELDDIYLPVGVDWQVSSDAFSYEGDKDNFLNTESSLLQSYTEPMKKLQAAYAAEGGIDKNTCYIFVLNYSGTEKNRNTAGFMPRGKQFGYIFLSNLKASEVNNAVAHELGHGLWKLRHTFDESYGNTAQATQGTTNNLMDYNRGTALAKWQWDMMSAPAIFDGVLDSDEEAMKIIETDKIINPLGYKYAYIDPSGRIIKSYTTSLEGHKVIAAADAKNYPYVRSGFSLYKKQEDGTYSFVKQYNAKFKDNLFVGYFNGDESLNDDNNTDIILSYYTGAESINCYYYEEVDNCVYRGKIVSGWKNPTEKLTYPELKIQLDKLNKRTHKLGHYFQVGKNCFVEFIKEAHKKDFCTEEAIKDDKELLDKHIHTNDLKELVLIVDNICISVLRNLDTDRKIKLFEKIAGQSSLAEESEVAVLRMMEALNSSEYPKFYASLEKEGNKLLLHLLSKMHDKSIYFWDGDNYTNFMGALATMYRIAPESYSGRLYAEGNEKLTGQVFNLHSKPFKSDFKSTNQIISGQTALNEFRFIGKFNPQTGKVTIYQQEKIRTSGLSRDFVTNNVTYETVEAWHSIEPAIAENISPFTPIVISAKDQLPLVQTALDEGKGELGNVYVVPAIFLQYIVDKEINEVIEKQAYITIDGITIFASGGTALATKVTWARRVWALSEVAGAAGNITVNLANDIIPKDSKIRTAIDIYNGAMLLIGVKNIGKGVYTFARNLAPETKNLLAKNGDLRSLLKENYQEYKKALAEAKLEAAWDNLDDATKQKLAQQEELYDELVDWEHLSDYAEAGAHLDRVAEVIRGVNRSQLTNSVTGLSKKTELIEEVWELWRAEKWKEMEILFVKHNLNGSWPPNRGFIEMGETTLKKGSFIDRYGGRFESGKFVDNGTFAAPENIPFGQRALPQDYLNNKEYRAYEIIKDIPNVKQGKTIPWFGQKGGGIQYEFEYTIEELIQGKYIKLK